MFIVPVSTLTGLSWYTEVLRIPNRNFVSVFDLTMKRLYKVDKSSGELLRDIRDQTDCLDDGLGWRYGEWTN